MKTSDSYTPPEHLSVEDFSDGLCYERPSVKFAVSNMDMAIASKDDVYLKTPSPSGMDYHRDFLYGKNRKAYGKDYWRRDQPIRCANDLEDSKKLDDALSLFPDLRNALHIYPDWQVRLSLEEMRIFVHYLVIHRMHYERLSALETIGVPKARFVFLRATRRLRPFILFGRVESRSTIVPAIVQERIDGTPLWSMYDFYIQGVRPEWQAHMPVIATQLSRIIDSSDFDWNPKNFLYREKDGRLFYIDSKPTTFGGRVNNDHNLTGIRRFFLHYDTYPDKWN